MLLTRAPLYRGRSPFSCDLHVLGAPLTFVLSQDQTLQLNLVSSQVAAEAVGAWALAWKLEGHFGHRLPGWQTGPRALRWDPLVDASGVSGRAATPEAHKVSVRFSFQGPREPAGSEVGGRDSRRLRRFRQGHRDVFLRRFRVASRFASTRSGLAGSTYRACARGPRPGARPSAFLERQAAPS